MSSYYNLEKHVYKEIKAEACTRIHGQSLWRVKETLAKEAGIHALRNKVSYDWSLAFCQKLLGLPALQQIAPTSPPTSNQCNHRTHQHCPLIQLQRKQEEPLTPTMYLRGIGQWFAGFGGSGG